MLEILPGWVLRDVMKTELVARNIATAHYYPRRSRTVIMLVSCTQFVYPFVQQALPANEHLGLSRSNRTNCHPPTQFAKL